MNDLKNSVRLHGNLGKDPEVRTAQSGAKFANFSIATDDSYKDKNGDKKEVTDWHNVQFSGPIVEVIEQYLKKGSKVTLSGKLKTRSYDKDGQKIYTTYVQGSSLLMHNEQKIVSEDQSDNLPF